MTLLSLLSYTFIANTWEIIGSALKASQKMKTYYLEFNYLIRTLNTELMKYSLWSLKPNFPEPLTIHSLVLMGSRYSLNGTRTWHGLWCPNLVKVWRMCHWVPAEWWILVDSGRPKVKLSRVSVSTQQGVVLGRNLAVQVWLFSKKEFTSVPSPCLN